MQENHLFEYAIVRVVPRVEREEFLNVGVIVFCKRSGFLQMKYTLNEERLHAFSATVDVGEIRSYLEAIERITLGSEGSGPIGKLDPPSRFRWLTAVRSTVVQTSRIHPGLSCNLPETLEKLYVQMVL